LHRGSYVGIQVSTLHRQSAILNSQACNGHLYFGMVEIRKYHFVTTSALYLFVRKRDLWQHHHARPSTMSLGLGTKMEHSKSSPSLYLLDGGLIPPLPIAALSDRTTEMEIRDLLCRFTPATRKSSACFSSIGQSSTFLPSSLAGRLECGLISIPHAGLV
jgi:hypothetical protein